MYFAHMIYHKIQLTILPTEPLRAKHVQLRPHLVKSMFIGIPTSKRSHDGTNFHLTLAKPRNWSHHATLFKTLVV